MIFDRFFEQWRKKTSPSGPRSPRKFFVRSLRPLPKIHEKKNCKPAYCAPAHKKNPTLIKVIFDRFFRTMTNIQLHHLHRAAPGKKFPRSLGPFSINHEEKIAKRHTVAMREYTKKQPHPYNSDQRKYNDENTTSPFGERNPLQIFSAFLGIPPPDPWGKIANRLTVAMRQCTKKNKPL